MSATQLHANLFLRLVVYHPGLCRIFGPSAQIIVSSPCCKLQLLYHNPSRVITCVAAFAEPVPLPNWACGPFRNGFRLTTALGHIVVPVSGNGLGQSAFDASASLLVSEVLHMIRRSCFRMVSYQASIASSSSTYGIWHTSTTVHSPLHQDRSAGHRRFYVSSHWRCIYSSCGLFFISSSLWASLLAANCTSYTPAPILDWFCS